MKREEILTEALPYIQQFHGKTMVIKLGAMRWWMASSPQSDLRCRPPPLVGIKVVLVHGGGPEITEKMKALGKQPKFVGVSVITDEETLEIAIDGPCWKDQQQYCIPDCKMRWKSGWYIWKRW